MRPTPATRRVALQKLVAATGPVAHTVFRTACRRQGQQTIRPPNSQSSRLLPKCAEHTENDFHQNSGRKLSAQTGGVPNPRTARVFHTQWGSLPAKVPNNPNGNLKQDISGLDLKLIMGQQIGRTHGTSLCTQGTPWRACKPPSRYAERSARSGHVDPSRTHHNTQQPFEIGWNRQIKLLAMVNVPLNRSPTKLSKGRRQHTGTAEDLNKQRRDTVRISNTADSHSTQC